LEYGGLSTPSKDISEKEYPDFLKEGAAKLRPPSKNRDILSGIFFLGDRLSAWVKIIGREF